MSEPTSDRLLTAPGIAIFLVVGGALDFAWDYHKTHSFNHALGAVLFGIVIASAMLGLFWLASTKPSPPK